MACHRQPERFLRPKDKITDMGWNIEADASDDVSADPFNLLAENLAPKRVEKALELKREYRIRSARILTSCSTCHR